MPNSKLVMGLLLYGRTWRLKDPAQHGIGAPAVGVGPGDQGLLPCAEVEAFNKDNKATMVYDSVAVSTYSYAGTSWVGYDDTTSIVTKVGFARVVFVGGYVFWSTNFDSKEKIYRQGTNFSSMAINWLTSFHICNRLKYGAVMNDFLLELIVYRAWSP